MSRWYRLVRSPGLHFVVLGGLLFAAERRWTPPRAVHPAGPPRTDEQILLDEALAIGLDHKDHFVRERLAGLVRVADAGAVEDAAGLEREARRLGLERHDVVVRRHLVQAMELALAHAGPQQVPSDAALAAYLEQHRERFMQPARLRFAQIFFARDRPGTPAAVVARAALTGLEDHSPTAAELAAVGDGFLGGPEASGSDAELARLFGAPFVETVAHLPVGHWAGPVQSAYGWHLVWVRERVPATLPSLTAVRGRLVQAVLADEATRRLERRLAERRARDLEGRS